MQVTATDCETVGKFCTSGALLKFTSGVVMVLQSLVTVMLRRIEVVAVPVLRGQARSDRANGARCS